LQACRKGGCRALLVAVAAALPCAAWAQEAEDKAAILKAQWTRVFLHVTQARNLTIVDNRLTSRAQDPLADQEAVRAAYQEVIDRLLAEPALRVFFDPDDPDVATISRPGDREWIARLAASGLDGRAAKSMNAAATNPAAARIAERSGFSDFIALAMDARNIFAASQTAMSLNLNAVALVGLKSADVYSAPEIYRQHGALRRLGGTVTFGAKVPESELTGFTGFPSADTLFEVFAWDVKYRVRGDRDPRADRWHREMLGTLGGLTELSAGLITLAPFGDLPMVQGLLNDRLGTALARVKTLVGNSLQVSVKAAGRHLTNTTGKSRYSAGILADKGLGNTDLTANILYTVSDGPAAPLALASFGAGVVTIAGGVNTLVARDALVRGRALELSVNVVVDVPVEDPMPPLTFDTSWRIAAGVAIPFAAAARIPVTITYASDPNGLVKQEFVTGHIGLDYDFGSLMKLFR
jgi:hypothetical protein